MGSCVDRVHRLVVASSFAVDASFLHSSSRGSSRQKNHHCQLRTRQTHEVCHRCSNLQEEGAGEGWGGMGGGAGEGWGG